MLKGVAAQRGEGLNMVYSRPVSDRLAGSVCVYVSRSDPHSAGQESRDISHATPTCFEVPVGAVRICKCDLAGGGGMRHSWPYRSLTVRNMSQRLPKTGGFSDILYKYC
jgi:hypothetical protein